MAVISTEKIKELREKTGAGISDVKEALTEAKGDTARALELIERKFGNIAAKKAGRATGSGLVESYVHSNGRIGSMVELLCETDFVARNPQFKEFAHDLAMHIAAMRPLYLSLDAVPADAWNAEKKRCAEDARALGKPEHVAEQIVDGKLKTYFGALALMNQPFIKDQGKTIQDSVQEAIGKFGENIKIGRFARFEI